MCDIDAYVLSVRLHGVCMLGLCVICAHGSGNVRWTMLSLWCDKMSVIDCVVVHTPMFSISSLSLSLHRTSLSPLATDNKINSNMYTYAALKYDSSSYPICWKMLQCSKDLILKWKIYQNLDWDWMREEGWLKEDVSREIWMEMYIWCMTWWCICVLHRMLCYIAHACLLALWLVGCTFIIRYWNDHYFCCW